MEIPMSPIEFEKFVKKELEKELEKLIFRVELIFFLEEIIIVHRVLFGTDGDNKPNALLRIKKREGENDE